jgi:hypothetical protein
MKKIVIDREEGIAEVIDRMAQERDDEVTLVIPKGSSLGRSVSNFHLLKREADAAGKTVLVESVDDTILAFAKQSDLESIHPLWHGVRGAGGIADIIPAEREEGGSNEEVVPEEKPAPKRRKKKAEPVKLTVHAEEEESSEITLRTNDETEEFEEKEEKFFGVGRFFKGKETSEVRQADHDEDEDNEEGGRRMPGAWVWWGGAAVIVVLIVLGIMTWSFGHVTITIDFQKTPWSYSGAFAADKSVSAVNPATNVIPAQVFTTQKNTTQLFPASGNATVSLKAQGTITVYNAYSSAAQELVATTRFVTPDGKIFRLVSGITVPGAQVTNGQIVPSSIQAPVIADQAGTNYNVGPVAKLTIPGLQNSPKYNGFYGALPNGASGGFVGTKPVPTAADVTNAKAKVTSLLQSDLASNLTTTYPNNFKILTGATNVSVTKLTVTTTTDANGNFSVFGEATLQAIGFDEAGFKSFLLSLAQVQDPSSTFSAVTLNYTNIQADFTKGRVSFSLTAQGTLEPIFSPDDFKASILGKSIGDARTAIGGLPQLADGSISAWPMWLWSIPGNPNKVQINAN